MWADIEAKLTTVPGAYADKRTQRARRTARSTQLIVAVRIVDTAALCFPICTRFTYRTLVWIINADADSTSQGWSGGYLRFGRAKRRGGALTCPRSCVHPP